MRPNHEGPRAGFFLAALLLTGGLIAASQAAPVIRSSHPPAVDTYRQPIRFEPNLGQTDPQVRYLARTPGCTLFLTQDEAVLAPAPAVGSRGPGKAALRMKLVGANPRPRMHGENRLPGVVHHLRGSDPARWRRHIPVYGRVRSESVYPGVDQVYYGNGRQLEYDFIVAPGADSDQIRLAFLGASRAELDPKGALILHTGSGRLRQEPPVAYQEVSGRRQAVEARYVVRSSPDTSAPQRLSAGTPLRVDLRVGDYDRTRPLVIDPVLWYSTFLGGTSDDAVNDLAVDPSGNVYVTGVTASTNFPTVNPRQPAHAGGSDAFLDAFVTKYAATGAAGEQPVVLYSTYLGGSNVDEGRGIVADASGSAYLTGSTGSFDFPTATPFQGSYQGGSLEFGSDAFVTKLSADGSTLVYSTYLGGSGNDFGNDIVLDSAGNAFVVGGTFSTNLPTTFTAADTTFNGAGDAFVAGMGAVFAGGITVPYLSYLGGTGIDVGNGIVLGTNFVSPTAVAIHVVGNTSSTNFPVTPGGTTDPDAFVVPGFNAQDAFYALLDSKVGGTPGRVISTYLGGFGVDSASGIAITGSNFPFVTGTTSSANFPKVFFNTSLHGPSDAFVVAYILSIDSATGKPRAKFNWTRFVGGAQSESGRAITADSVGTLILTGSTRSSDFPAPNALDPNYNGGLDAFVLQVNGFGSVIFGTFLGGAGDEEGRAVALDASSRAHVAGFTTSATFPLLAPSQPVFGGGQDGFVTKIGRLDQPPRVQCSVRVPSLHPPNHGLVDVGLQVQVSDDEDPRPTFQVAVFSSEDDVSGSSSHSPDANLAGGRLRLRAERRGSDSGRVYLIVVTARDAAGNASVACCTVVVPANQSPRTVAAVNAQAGAAESFCKEYRGLPPDGYFVVGDGPVIGPKQ